ncbi:MAG TPA: hypothetical protein VMK65_07560 [Longimicrobiales bacterium]|nr:hypothetical protein [Longimicrobiales bacterium]
MTMIGKARAGAVVALTAGLLSAGCASGGGELGDILGGVLGGGTAQQGQVVGEVQAVDVNDREIDFRTEDGRYGSVAYDASTRVIYEGREYRPTALERGDLVVMHVQETANGQLYTERVEVRQSVQDRGDTGQNASTLTGRVSWVDTNAGRFGLDRSNGGMVTVSLPWDATRQTVDRFRALRQGDTVRIEGQWLNDDRVEVVRFY